MNTAIAPNKRLDQIYSYVQGLTDEQLAQLVQKNPESTEATLALGQIQSRNDFRQRAQGQQGETPTVKENVLSSGLPSVMPQQNNQDPRLMAGMGSMSMTPRDSMDTPMNGVASLPTQQMQMASGGIVGYAGPDGSFVGEPFDPSSLMVEMGPDGMPVTPAYDLESDGLNEEQGMLSQAAPYILGGLAVADPALRVAERIQFGGIGSIAKGVRKVGEAYRKRALKGKKYQSPGRPPSGPGGPPKAPKKKVGESQKDFNARKQKHQTRKENYDAKKKDYDARKKTYDEKVKNIKEDNVKVGQRRDGRTDKQIVRNRIARDAALTTGLGGLTAMGYQGVQNMEEAPLKTMRGLREMGPSRGSEAIAPAAPAEKADRKRYPNLGNFLQAAGLSYASGKNLGESGIAGLGYMDDQKALESKMTDREQLEFARETAIMEAQMKAAADAGLSSAEVKDLLTFKEGLTATDLNNQAATILAQDYGGDLAAFGQAYQITAGKEAIQQKLMEVAKNTLVNNRMQSYLTKGGTLARDVSAPDIPTTVVR